MRHVGSDMLTEQRATNSKFSADSIGVLDAMSGIIEGVEGKIGQLWRRKNY